MNSCQLLLVSANSQRMTPIVAAAGTKQSLDS